MKFSYIKDLNKKVPKPGSFKHYLRIQEDGRIVKGVNTTVDVGTDEIKKQAAKFGFKVDKDGRPQNHPSKVKGSKTNVLFNLGLTESVAIKFERTDDYDVLHIKEKGKNRVEVRGKSGYESGNYDPKDKLHKLLDSLGKAANISELMNGETVVINPKHPDGPKAINNLTDLEEALGEIASATEIYVDMDGVLADFFGDWAKLMNVKDFRDIKDVPAGLEKIKQTENFWLNLPLTNNAKQLLGLIKKVKGNYKILSSPLPGDPKSEPHKRKWIEKNLAFFLPQDVIITHDKAKYATQRDGTPNILIDDYGVNIQKWESAGGYGFKHKDHKFERTAKAIKQHMQEPVEEGAEITMWTNPEYQGADVDDKYYKKQPVKIVDVSKLTPFEPADKMDPKDNHDNMMRFVDKIKAGKKIKPIVIVPHKGKLLIVDGHHRYFAHLKAGVDKVRAVVADPKDVTWRDDVPESVQENFADGKKKGKSRPGRVKRSGASCNGSVTDLRKRAKNASGEKAKMYHWCANMKSGRNK